MNENLNEQLIDFCSNPENDNKKEELLEILSKGADIEYESENKNAYNTYGPATETALMRAIRANSIELIETLIGQGANVNHCRSSDKVSPLMLAATYQLNVATNFFFENTSPNEYGEEIVKMIIDAGADINYYAPNAGDALSYWRGATSGSEMFSMIVENTKEFNRTTHDGSNCLIPLIKFVDIDNFKILHKKGADIHHINNLNHNVIMNAAAHHREDIIMYLLDNNADISLVSSYNGKTLVQILEDKAMFETIELLKKYPMYQKLNSSLENGKVNKVGKI
jgi:ankyrin repeat protein